MLISRYRTELGEGDSNKLENYAFEGKEIQELAAEK